MKCNEDMDSLLPGPHITRVVKKRKEPKLAPEPQSDTVIMILSPGLGGVMTILGVQQVQCCRMNHFFQDCPEMSVAMDRKRFSAAGLGVKE